MSGSEPPLTLQILRIIEKFSPKKLPVAFLYYRIPASRADIERQVNALVEQGAVKIEGDQVSLADS
jgi:DNA-binding IclR family transcriptional regulator